MFKMTTIIIPTFIISSLDGTDCFSDITSAYIRKSSEDRFLQLLDCLILITIDSILDIVPQEKVEHR